jgi:predicted ATP-dependent serine protease
MLKDLTVRLDTEDALEAKVLLAYYASDDSQKLLKKCVMLGYLVASGEVRVVQDEEDANASESAQGEGAEQSPKAVGNSLFGIKSG